MPLYRRLPKRGFTNIWGTEYTIVNVEDLNKFEAGAVVDQAALEAAVSMPIMAPLADLVGVTRQTACIAFQLGDGISNIFTPTSGYFMAGLALAKVPWSKWAKWILPLIGLQYLLGMIFVIVAQVTQLG